jgi:CBS domain-containing protein
MFCQTKRRLPNSWLHVPGAEGATSYYDSIALRDVLEKLIDFDVLSDARKRFGISVDLGAKNIGAVVVADGQGSVIGILSERDIRPLA